MTRAAQPRRLAPTATRTRIKDVVVSPGQGAFFFDDQAAIKDGAVRDGASYIGRARTPGYRAVREPAESVSIMLVLDDGYVASGDAASVQYSGVGGREPRLRANAMAEAIKTTVAPQLRGMRVGSFRSSAEKVESLTDGIANLGRAAAYGLSQALLSATAHTAGHHLMARVIRDEWQLDQPLAPVPIYGQSGEDRYDSVDKMILKQVDVLPHGLINTPELVGLDGEKLEDYIRWIKSRVFELRPAESYVPVLHVDVYGLLGAVTNSLGELANIIDRLARAAAPLRLRLEHPVDAGRRDAQIRTLTTLRGLLRERGIPVDIVADEWANTAVDVKAFAAAAACDMIQIKAPDLGSLHNTVDAVLSCQQYGVGPILGGTCAETDTSARAGVHIAIATGVVQLLAKPGMGFDEGFAIVSNEMSRALRLDQALGDGPRARRRPV